MQNIETPKYPIYDNGQLHISISQKNGKLGNIPQFNTLPGDEPLTLATGKPLTNIKGTCGKHCEECKSECYAIRSAILHHDSVIPAWGRNTVILRNNPEKVRSEIRKFCLKNIVKYFRFHTAGELESVEQLKLYCDICEENPDVTFYIYTKRFDLVADYFVYKNNILPENFVINLSEWHGNINDYISNTEDIAKVGKFFNSLNMFAYDDHTPESETASKMIHCPAIDETGHETGITCAQCRRCMRKGNKTAVYQH